MNLAQNDPKNLDTVLKGPKELPSNETVHPMLRVQPGLPE